MALERGEDAGVDQKIQAVLIRKAYHYHPQDVSSIGHAQV
jgi:hypothetical protein